MIKRNDMYFLFLFVTSVTLPLNDCTVHCTLYSLAFDQNKFISSADQSPPLFCSKSIFQTDQFIKLLNEYDEAGIFLFFRHWTVNSSCTIFEVALGYQLIYEHYHVLPFFFSPFSAKGRLSLSKTRSTSTSRCQRSPSWERTRGGDDNRH